MSQVAERKFEENGNKTVTFTQKYNFKFKSDPLAPIKSKDGKVGRPRFSIEDMIYISGVGWEIVDPNAAGNEYMKGVLNFIRIKEGQGYEHTGLNSIQYKEYLEQLWGKKEEDW